MWKTAGTSPVNTWLQEYLLEYPREFEFRFNRRRARTLGLLFYRLTELPVETGPITYADIAVSGTREREPVPAPPGSLHYGITWGITSDI